MRLSNPSRSRPSGRPARTGRSLRRAAALPLVLVSLLGVASCGSRGDSQPEDPGPAIAQPVAPPQTYDSPDPDLDTPAPAVTVTTDPDVPNVPAAPAAPAVSVPGSVSGSVTAVSSEGVKVSVGLTFDAPVHEGSAAATAWSAAGGHGAIPCAAGSNQDAVLVGTLTFTDLTPSYVPDLYVNFQQFVTGGPVSLGAGFSSGYSCVTDGSDGWEGSAIQPTWTHGQAAWGPLAIAVVVKDYYGPAHPHGDTSLLGTTDFVVASQSDTYQLKSAQGILSQLNGASLSLDLGAAAR